MFTEIVFLFNHWEYKNKINKKYETNVCKFGKYTYPHLMIINYLNKKTPLSNRSVSRINRYYILY